MPFSLAATDLFIILVAILVSLGFHEAMHAFMGHWLGDTTASDMGRLTLNPLKHIDLFTTVLIPIILIVFGAPPFFAAKPVPFNPDRVKWDEYGAALIGLAGPFTNLFLAVVTAILIRVFGVAAGTEVFSILSIFIQVNIGFFVFNMIPFPPLDGSRLLYAFAPEPLQQIMYKIESFGFTAIIIFFFLLFPVLSPAVSFVSLRILDILL